VSGPVELHDDGLARWACRGATSRGRAHPEGEHPYRSPFQRDRDRVIHSRAFRRLEYKTQVFVNHEGDYYRTRLTHTIEVAQIARTIARQLGLNEDLTEAIALAHDLGHTPFGHSGEHTLNELMQNHGGFEHNRHGLRVVDLLEKQYASFEGLNLSYEVREAFVRHETTYDKPTDPGPEFPADEQVHLEGQAVCAADAIAYNSHDLDDGLFSGLIGERDLAGVALWERAAGAVTGSTAGDDKLRRHATVRRLIDVQVSDLIATSTETIRSSSVRDLDDVRACGRWLVGNGAPLAREQAELQDVLFARLYRHYRVMRMANKAARFLEELFREFVEHPDGLPEEHRERAARDPLARVVCDYIAGMTDRYAQDAYKQLFHPYERM
jgi:dGTPase